jgi:hypothetical protein
MCAKQCKLVFAKYTRLRAQGDGVIKRRIQNRDKLWKHDIRSETVHSGIGSEELYVLMLKKRDETCCTKSGKNCMLSTDGVTQTRTSAVMLQLEKLFDLALFKIEVGVCLNHTFYVLL